MIDDMAVYIANLGKYNEGYLVGAWFTFPIDEEDVKEKIGLNEQYEEYAIHDTDNFPIAIGEYTAFLFCSDRSFPQPDLCQPPAGRTSIPGFSCRTFRRE